MSRSEAAKIQGREMPPAHGIPTPEKAKQLRRAANKRYRTSLVGRERAKARRAVRKVKDAFTREFMDQHPNYVADLKKKYFRNRLDGANF